MAQPPAVATPAGRSRAFTYLSLASSMLIGLWVVPTLKKSLQAVFCGSSPIDLDPGFLRDVRSVLALMTFLRVTGLAINEANNEEGGEIAALWQDTADFETACVSTLNQIMSDTNLERLNLLGDCLERIGVTFAGGSRNVILNLLGWR